MQSNDRPVVCVEVASRQFLNKIADQITGHERGVMSSIWCTARGTEVLSSITNLVCPDCGGRMGGRGKEFTCQGECQKDWRETWEQRYSTERGYRPRRLPGHRRTQL